MAPLRSLVAQSIFELSNVPDASAVEVAEAQERVSTALEQARARRAGSDEKVCAILATLVAPQANISQGEMVEKMEAMYSNELLHMRNCV